MKQEKIKLIIFDAYGVVFSRGYPETCQLLAKRFKIPYQRLMDVIYKKYFNQAAECKITQKVAWQLSVKELNLPVSWQKVRDLHQNLLKINQLVLKIVQKLRKDYKVIMLSKNTRSQFVYSKNKFYAVWQSFDKVVNTWELGLPKASKETILTLAKKFEVKPNEILYIDDQKDNLVAPQKMGVKTIFYKNFSQFRKELSKHINFQINKKSH